MTIMPPARRWNPHNVIFFDELASFLVELGRTVCLTEQKHFVLRGGLERATGQTRNRRAGQDQQATRDLGKSQADVG